MCLHKGLHPSLLDGLKNYFEITQLKGLSQTSFKQIQEARHLKTESQKNTAIQIAVVRLIKIKKSMHFW